MAASGPGGSAAESAYADLDLLVRRLRGLSPLAWKARQGAVRRALDELIDLASQAEGRDLPRPDLPNHSLADALAVIAYDLLDSSDQVVMAEAAALIRTVLAETK